VAVATLGPNDVFGERALIDHLPRNLTAVATEETTLAEIDRSPFLFLVHESSTFALGIVGALAGRLRDYDDLIGATSPGGQSVPGHHPNEPVSRVWCRAGYEPLGSAVGGVDAAICASRSFTSK